MKCSCLSLFLSFVTFVQRLQINCWTLIHPYYMKLLQIFNLIKQSRKACVSLLTSKTVTNIYFEYRYFWMEGVFLIRRFLNNIIFWCSVHLTCCVVALVIFVAGPSCPPCWTFQLLASHIWMACLLQSLSSCYHKTCWLAMHTLWIGGFNSGSLVPSSHSKDHHTLASLTAPPAVKQQVQPASQQCMKPLSSY